MLLCSGCSALNEKDTDIVIHDDIEEYGDKNSDDENQFVEDVVIASLDNNNDNDNVCCGVELIAGDEFYDGYIELIEAVVDCASRIR